MDGPLVLTGLDYPFLLSYTIVMFSTAPVILIAVHTIILSFGNIRMIELKIFLLKFQHPGLTSFTHPAFHVNLNNGFQTSFVGLI